MKSLIVVLASFLTIASTGPITVADFKPLEDLKGELGMSANTKKAAAFAKLYHNNDHAEFRAALLEYLAGVNYKHSDNYGWYSFFLEGNYETQIDDVQLAQEVLDSGLVQLPARLHSCTNFEDSMYFSMAHCRVLWMKGIYHFDRDELEEGGYYWDLANKNEDCWANYPGDTEERVNALTAKYEKYKSMKSN